MMEDALRLNVKWSLMELSRAINGDGKTSPNPLFRVKVILQDNSPGQTPQVSRGGLLTSESNFSPPEVRT